MQLQPTPKGKPASSELSMIGNVSRGLGSARDYTRIAPDAHLGSARTPDCNNADPPQPDNCTMDGDTSYPNSCSRPPRVNTASPRLFCVTAASTSQAAKASPRVG